MVHQGLAADPAFVPSLRLLVERERYSLEDISMMFGVSRERIRQLCKQHQVVHPDSARRRGLTMVRVWVDALNRFMPMPKESVVRAQRQRASLVRLSAHTKAVADRRAHIVEQVRSLAAELGRDPTVGEIATKLSGRPMAGGRAPMYIIAKWGAPGSTTKERYRRVMAELREAAGIQARPRGFHGAVNRPQRSQTHCKRGHLLAETRHPKWKYCRPCVAQRRRESQARTRPTERLLKRHRGALLDALCYAIRYYVPNDVSARSEILSFINGYEGSPNVWAQWPDAREKINRAIEKAEELERKPS